jgi:hypothetical protein
MDFRGPDIPTSHPVHPTNLAHNTEAPPCVSVC